MQLLGHRVSSSLNLIRHYKIVLQSDCAQHTLTRKARQYVFHNGPNT